MPCRGGSAARLRSLLRFTPLSTVLLKRFLQERCLQEGKPAEAGLVTQPTGACVGVLTAEGGSEHTKRNHIFASSQFLIPLLQVASQISSLVAEEVVEAFTESFSCSFSLPHPLRRAETPSAVFSGARCCLM